MARYIDAIDLPIPPEEAFDYLADFSRTAEWDPGVCDAHRLTRGKIRLGSRFEVSVSFFGRRIPLEYRITEFERPSRLVLTGGDAERLMPHLEYRAELRPMLVLEGLATYDFA